jgi:hypothetical protein
MSFKDNLDIDVLKNYLENNCLPIFATIEHVMIERQDVIAMRDLARSHTLDFGIL